MRELTDYIIRVEYERGKKLPEKLMRNDEDTRNLHDLIEVSVSNPREGSAAKKSTMKLNNTEFTID